MLTLAEADAAGANPRCGSTLTHSVKLTANMICRISNGLDVGRSGITVNLNGHTIRAPGGPSSYNGIYNDGYGRVTIENGTIRNFEDGIFEQATHGSKILKATVHGSGEARILYEYSQDSVIKRVGVNAPPHLAYQADLIGNRADDNADYGFYAEYRAKGRQNHATGNSVSNCYRVPGCG